MTSPPVARGAVSRTLVVVASGFLLLDGVLLGAAGLFTGRPLLMVAGGAALVAAGAVVLSWRRHRKRLAELDAERAALRDDVAALRDLFRGP